MRITLAQLNPIVGDVIGNIARLRRALDEAHRQGGDIVVTSELMLIGYPPRDLLLREGVVEACEAAVEHLATLARGCILIVGTPRCVRTDQSVHRVRNSAAVCAEGRIVGWYDKRLLPGYDVFDEDRYFDPGTQAGVFNVNGRRLGVLTCEDLWGGADNDAAPDSYAVSPVDELAAASCDLVVVLNASPFSAGKPQRHRTIIREAAKRLKCPVVAVNQVGGNDDLIFDGRSVVVTPDGLTRHASPAWEESVTTVDLDTAGPVELIAADTTDDLTRALTLGLRDYVLKTGHQRVLLGLSGGIDSAVTAVLAALALGPSNVTGVMMPSRYSSPGSLGDARELAERLGIASCPELSIRQAHETIRNTLGPLLGDDLDGLPDENIQARLRGLLLMTISNAQGSLVLATANKSELAVGYSTLYGDMCGAVSVIGDLLKTQVYEIARWINANAKTLGFERAPIPESTITKAPSAELRPDQTDQDSLPPYDILDPIIAMYVHADASVDDIVQAMPDHAGVVRAITRSIDLAQYKREQASVILKVSPRTFGRGRPMPIVMRDTASRAAVDKLSMSNSAPDAPPRPVVESTSD
jgi:NAD+ synthetase